VEQGEIVFLMSPSAVVNNWHAKNCTIGITKTSPLLESIYATDCISNYPSFKPISSTAKLLQVSYEKIDFVKSNGILKDSKNIHSPLQCKTADHLPASCNAHSRDHKSAY
jgi:hypothetical protein